MTEHKQKRARKSKPIANLTIYDIKERTMATSPYFFSEETLKFWGQKMESFHVEKLTETTYRISATRWMPHPTNRWIEMPNGQTVRIFDTVSNTLTMEQK
jgi:hypothetical protein